MPLLIGILAIFAPRLAIFLLVIFGDYIGTAYDTVIWPFLGFLCMPFTTLAYAFAWHQGEGSVQGVGLILVIFTALVDLGVVGKAKSQSGKKD